MDRLPSIRWVTGTIDKINVAKLNPTTSIGIRFACDDGSVLCTTNLLGFPFDSKVGDKYKLQLSCFKERRIIAFKRI